MFECDISHVKYFTCECFMRNLTYVIKHVLSHMCIFNTIVCIEPYDQKTPKEHE